MRSGLAVLEARSNNARCTDRVKHAAEMPVDAFQPSDDKIIAANTKKPTEAKYAPLRILYLGRGFFRA